MNDDEPTLETDRPKDDDEPTLETEPQAGVAGGLSEDTTETRAAEGFGWGSRLERMTAAKREHRRRLMGRFWLAAGPVLILLVVAMVLLAIYGGQNDDPSAAPTVTVTRAAAEGSALLLLQKDEALVLVVMLQPWSSGVAESEDGTSATEGGAATIGAAPSGGAVLAVPGLTLLEVQGSFQTLTEIYSSDGPEAVRTALARALDLPLGPVAVAGWDDLAAALASAGMQGLPAEAELVAQGEAAARVIRDFVAGFAVGGSAEWEELWLQGEAAGFLRAVEIDAAAMAANVWSAGGLGGTVVDGEGYWYLEPDIEAARSLLIVTSEPAVVMVEVKDGAGVEGAARAAGDLFEAAGFALAPMSYAQDYPGVVQTQILHSAGNLAEAQQLQSILGIGEMVEDETLRGLRIVVILGKDYQGATSTSTSTTSLLVR